MRILFLVPYRRRYVSPLCVVFSRRILLSAEVGALFNDIVRMESCVSFGRKEVAVMFKSRQSSWSKLGPYSWRCFLFFIFSVIYRWRKGKAKKTSKQRIYPENTCQLILRKQGTRIFYTLLHSKISSCWIGCEGTFVGLGGVIMLDEELYNFFYYGKKPVWSTTAFHRVALFQNGRRFYKYLYPFRALKFPYYN